MAPETVYKHCVLDILCRAFCPETGKVIVARDNLISLVKANPANTTTSPLYYRVNNEVFIRGSGIHSFLYTNTQYVGLESFVLYKENYLNKGADYMFSKMRGYPIFGNNCIGVRLAKNVQRDIDILKDWDVTKLNYIYAFTKFVNALPNRRTVINFIEKYTTPIEASYVDILFWDIDSIFEDYIEDYTSGVNYELIEQFETKSPTLIEKLSHNKFLLDMGK